jgi:hypothetical protein
MKERELNPYLRQQSNDHGRSKAIGVGDAGLEWHRRAYERCKQQAQEQQRPLSDIVAERYGVRAAIEQGHFDKYPYRFF